FTGRRYGSRAAGTVHGPPVRFTGRRYGSRAAGPVHGPLTRFTGHGLFYVRPTGGAGVFGHSFP
ncbi:hypothetical protein, partial [Enterocloster hominis (ex Hitch et al. 2024)]